MGDNYRRALAYPRHEGECPRCHRWLAIGPRGVTPRHRCFWDPWKETDWRHGDKPAAVSPTETEYKKAQP